MCVHMGFVCLKKEVRGKKEEKHLTYIPSLFLLRISCF